MVRTQIASAAAAQVVLSSCWVIVAGESTSGGAKFTDEGGRVFATSLGLLRADRDVFVGGPGFVEDPRDLVALLVVPIAVGYRWRGSALRGPRRSTRSPAAAPVPDREAA